MANAEIKAAAKAAKVKLWEVADALSCTDCYFSRRLRYELPETEKYEILGVIQELAKKRKDG